MSGLSVIILSNVPQSVKGYASVYFVQVSPGVYVGNVSARVRELLWSKLLSTKKLGAATMIYTDDSEQGFHIETHMSHHSAVDFDGIDLIEYTMENRASRLGDRRLTDELEFLRTLTQE